MHDGEGIAEFGAAYHANRVATMAKALISATGDRALAIAERQIALGGGEDAMQTWSDIVDYLRLPATREA